MNALKLRLLRVVFIDVTIQIRLLSKQCWTLTTIVGGTFVMYIIHMPIKVSVTSEGLSTFGTIMKIALSMYFSDVTF